VQAQTAETSAEVVDAGQLFAAIEHARSAVTNLERRLDGTEGYVRIAVDSRLTHARMNLLESNLAFLARISEEVQSGQADDEQRQKGLEVFESQLQTIDATEKLIAARIVPPAEDLSAAKTAAAFSRTFELVDLLNRVFAINIASLQHAEQMGVDVAAEREKLERKLLDRAENSSVFLEITMNQVAALRASVAAVPDDAEVKARLNVFIKLVSDLAGGMARILELMKSLEMDTTSYQNQLLAATGEITTDVFQIDVFTRLLVGWGNTLRDQIIESGPGLIFKLVLLIIIVFIFYKLAGLVQRLRNKVKI